MFLLETINTAFDASNAFEKESTQSPHIISNPVSRGYERPLIPASEVTVVYSLCASLLPFRMRLVWIYISDFYPDYNNRGQ